MKASRMYAVRAALAVAFDNCDKCFEQGIFPIVGIMVYGTVLAIIVRIGCMSFTHSMSGVISIPGGVRCIEMNQLINDIYLANFSSQGMCDSRSFVIDECILARKDIL